MTENLMEQALAAAGLGVLVLDEAGRILEGTRSAAALLGRDCNELIGKPIAAILPLDPGVVTQILETPAVPAKNVIEVTVGNEAAAGDALAVNLVHWADAAGNRRTSAILRDVATEKELARIAQRDMIQSDHAIRGANIAVFEYDLATQSVHVSKIWRQMLEIEPFENIDVQEEWRSRVHPEDLAQALEPIHLCGDDLAERASCEYRLLTRDRSHWRWLRTEIAVAERDDFGKPSVLVGAQTDVTERKQAEEALRLSNQQLLTAFDCAPIGMAMVSLDGRWLRINPALCDLLGYDEAEFLATDFQTLTHPDDLEADLALIQSLLAGEIPYYRLAKRYIRANAAIMWGLLTVGLVRDADGKPDHFVAQILDITEQRRLDELRSEFVSVVSHELRTPLTAILGSLMLLSTHDEAEFSDEVQRLLYIAKANGDRLHHLVNDILDFQKFAAQQMRFTLSRRYIADVVEETLLANLASADRHDTRYATHIPDRSLTALIDPKRLHQIMANLLSNATKFAAPNSVVEVSVTAEENAVRIAVSNIGPGIPESFHSRVFKPFSQAGSVSDRRSGGTGLGLSITKQIVEQMGGQIGFDSVPNGQTTFWFTVRAGDER